MSNYDAMLNETKEAEAKKAAKEAAKKGNYPKVEGMYHKCEKGPNQVRLSGDYVKVQTHSLGGFNNGAGLVSKDSIAKKEVPIVMNCPNWDIENKTWVSRDDATCPICAIKQKLWVKFKEESDNMTDEEVKELKDMINKLNTSEAIKWNVIDRDNPNIKVTEDGVTTEKLGYKVASFGKSIYEGIQNFFLKMKKDLATPEDGIDFEIVKKVENTKTSYTVSPVMGDDMSVKKTPFTEEEKALELLDLKKICGKQTDLQKVVDNLLPEYKEYLDAIGYVVPVKEEKKEEAKASESSESANDDAPACHGQFDFDNTSPECESCEWSESCKESTPKEQK